MICSPAHVMPLLEIIRTDKTSSQVIVDLLDVGKKIKKTPVVVGNCTGFAVNRMFFPYTQAALLLVDRGADIYQIDRAITKFGMPMGPFRYIFLQVSFDEMKNVVYMVRSSTLSYAFLGAGCATLLGLVLVSQLASNL